MDSVAGKLPLLEPHPQPVESLGVGGVSATIGMGWGPGQRDSQREKVLLWDRGPVSYLHYVMRNSRLPEDV